MAALDGPSTEYQSLEHDIVPKSTQFCYVAVKTRRCKGACYKGTTGLVTANQVMREIWSMGKGAAHLTASMSREVSACSIHRGSSAAARGFTSSAPEEGSSARPTPRLPHLNMHGISVSSASTASRL